MIVLQPKQVSELVNTGLKNVLGPTEDGSPMLQEDLTGVIDAGLKIADVENGYVNFLYELGVAVSARIFVDRTYTSKAPNIFKTSFEYGQIIQKTRAALVDASDNQAYELVNGASYDDNIYYGGTVETKIFTKRDTWQIVKSIPEDQIKNAFTSAQEMGNFVSMIFTMIQNSIQVNMDKLVMMTINNFIGEVLKTESNVTAVNLLKEYKAMYPETQLNADSCLRDKEFLKYAYSRIDKITGLMQNYSTIFNLNKKQVFTPKDKQHIVLLQEFASNLKTYLESDTFHNDLLKLPMFETVSFWQGIGNSGDFTDTSSINIKTTDGTAITKSGIIGIVFDDDACGVNHIEEKRRANYNNSGEFINHWFKQVMGYFNDYDENFVVFFVADTE